MQVEIPQIFWHDNSARILSVDVYPNSNYFVTASVVSDDDSGIRVSQGFSYIWDAHISLSFISSIDVNLSI
jgi:hypothetical protein